MLHLSERYAPPLDAIDKNSGLREVRTSVLGSNNEGMTRERSRDQRCVSRAVDL